jgi:uncharacterized protein
MSAKSHWALHLAGTCVLAACQSSPPTHYFALTEIAPTAPRGTVAAQVPIRVERVTIPGELDRLEIVRRGASNQVQIAAFDRWAAPLEDMIRRVMAQDLAARLAPGTIANVNEPSAAEPRNHLYVGVQEFAGDEQGAVRLHAAWLLQTSNAASTRGIEEIRVTADNATADALAAAMSRALAAFADRIAAALATHPAGEKSE